MLLLGVVSGVFSNIKFSIPGLYAITLDLREIPLLISIFYFTNPVYMIGLSIVSTLFTPNIENYEVVNFGMHAIGLVVIYFAYQKLHKSPLSSVLKVTVLGFLIVVLYYTVILFSFVLLDMFYQSTPKTDLPIINYFFSMLRLSIVEALFTGLAVAFLYTLYIYKSNLQEQIRVRTDELYKAHEDLKQAHEKLIQEEKLSSLRIFTAGIAHEINNPLNFINGAIYILNDFKDKVPLESQNAWQQMSNMLKTGYSRIKKIVRDLTYFSYDTGYKIEKKDIHKIIGMALIMLRPNIPKGLRIKTNYKLKGLVPVHTENFHSVIVNLVLNAVHATTNSDAKIKLVEITTKQVGENAHITVYNTGDNIPSNEINKIFNPFFTTKDPQEGTGLGLSICYTLVNTHHNGQIKVENMPNGVKFTVILPLQIKEED